MQANIRNRFLLALVVISPFVLFLGFFLFMSEDQIPLPPLPAQNGYGDLVKAGQMVSANTDDFDKEDQQTIEPHWVSENAAALALAHTVLTNQCAVPLQFSQDYINGHLDDLAALKRLGRAFDAEGQLAEMQNHSNDAVHSYLDVIRLGDDSSRGGTLIDELVGIALLQIGAADLQKIVPQLGRAHRRQAAAELETIGFATPDLGRCRSAGAGMVATRVYRLPL